MKLEISNRKKIEVASELVGEGKRGRMTAEEYEISFGGDGSA